MQHALTLQEIFDTAIGGLFRQGCKSVVYGLGCAYRGDNGSKCGVGFLIPDEFYKPEMESTPAITALGMMADVGGPVYEVDALKLALDIQGMHDGMPLYQWRARAQQIAHIHNLQFNF